jgi:tetratricopeptide (TPR) repeat protein
MKASRRLADAVPSLTMRVASFVAALAIALLARHAAAGDPGARPAPTKQEQAAAGKKFREGEKAYARHDYATAAAAFEEAYALAPHPDALLNAIDARRKGGELRVAAELCQRLLRDFPDGKPASEARERLADLTPKLGRLDLTAKGGAKELTIDGRPAELGEAFVDPGDHVITGVIDGQRVERRASVVAGARASVLLERAPKKEETEAPAAPPPTAPPAPDEKPLHMSAFFVGLGLTAVAGGVLVWSGLDTNAARDEFEKNPTRPAYEEGLDKELRTNVLIGVTAGLGAATALVAIFTDWGGGDAAPASGGATTVGVGPGSFDLKVTF